MSWKVGLYLSESFAEVSALNNALKTPISKIWYLRSKNLVEGLRDFFDQNKIDEGAELKLSSFWPQMVVQKNLGTPPAFLTSSGFEDWLMLRQPKKLKPRTLPPERQRSFFNSDLTFGISERTDAEGKIQKSPTEEELEFLHQKFLLSNTKSIAIGFIHSSKNPENEKQVAKFFEERGYRVWPSYKYSGGLNEVGRWWRAGLEAYIANTIEELNAPLLAFVKEKSLKLVTEDLSSLSNSFEIFNGLRNYYKNTNYDCLLWADLRAFTLVDLKKDQKITETLWGPIAADTPRLKTLNLRPTSLIENEGMRGFYQNFFDIGFDPGPMSFGRGVKPTFFDVLYAFDILDVPPEISQYINTTTKDKITQSLAIGMRVLLKNEPRWHEFLAGWLRSQIAAEIIEFVETPKLLVAGPLATSIAKLFENRELEFSLNVELDSAMCASQARLRS